MLHSVYIENFRNLQQINYSAEAGVNVFEGCNAAGKTSLLEAIFFLASSRSFRGSPVNGLIKHNEKQLLIRSKLSAQGVTHHVGMQRSPHETRLKIDSEPATKISQISQLLPIVAIHPRSDELLVGSPEQRRKFIDQIGFHLIDNYIQSTQRFSRVLKQKNKILKDQLQLGEWQGLFIETAEVLEKNRIRSIELLTKVVNKIATEIKPEWQIDIHYLPGYRKNEQLADILRINLDKEYERRVSLYGPHRADLDIRINGCTFKHTGSRGEIKLLTYLLNMAAARLWQQQKNHQPILLLDDPVSELDDGHLKQLLQWIDHNDYQTLISCIDAQHITTWVEQAKCFKLEQGTLLE